MKVAILYDGLSIPPKDGVTYRAYHVIKMLIKKGADVSLFFGDRGWVNDRELLAMGLECTIFPASWLYNKRIEKVAVLLKKAEVNILHVCNSHPIVLFYGKYLSNQLGIPLICDMHDIDYKLYAELKMTEPEIENARILQFLIAKCCDEIISISSDDHQSLLKLGVPEDKLHLIPNGINIQPYRQDMRGMNIVFIGNLFYQPNNFAAKLIIDQIAPTIFKRFHEANFYIIGRTPKEFHNLVRDSRIKLVGEQDRLDTWINQSSVAIAPLFQGSGMKVKMLTYGSFGLPTIGTDIALSGYDKQNAFIVANSTTEFIDKITWVLEHPDEATLLGKQLYKQINKEYLWDSLVEKLIAVYQNTQRRPSEIFDNIELTSTAEINPTVISAKKIPLPLWLTEKRFNQQVKNQKSRTLRSGKIINIEGLWGSGKTTLARKLASDLKAVYIPEPDHLSLNEKPIDVELWYWKKFKQIEIMADQAKNEGKTVILDRSRLSLLSFLFAQGRIKLLKKLETELEVSLFKPDMLVIINSNLENLVQVITDPKHKKLSKTPVLANNPKFVKRYFFYLNNNSLKIHPKNYLVTSTDDELLNRIKKSLSL